MIRRTFEKCKTLWVKIRNRLTFDSWKYPPEVQKILEEDRKKINEDILQNRTEKDEELDDDEQFLKLLRVEKLKEARQVKIQKNVENIKEAIPTEKIKETKPLSNAIIDVIANQNFKAMGPYPTIMFNNIVENQKRLNQAAQKILEQQWGSANLYFPGLNANFTEGSANTYSADKIKTEPLEDKKVIRKLRWKED